MKKKINAKLRKNLFWTNEKFVFFFNCSDWEKFMEKIGGNKIGCLVVWCHKQDNIRLVWIGKKMSWKSGFVNFGIRCWIRWARYFFWILWHLMILLNQLQAPQLYNQIWKSSRQNLLQRIWIYLDNTNLIRAWGKNMGLSK